MGEVFDMKGEPFVPGNAEIIASTEYASVMAPDIIEKFKEFGLDPLFIPIIGQHLLDLEVVYSRTSRKSTLGVNKVFTEGDRRGRWQRQAMLSYSQIAQYQQCLITSMTGSRFEDSLLPDSAPVIDINGNVIDDGLNNKMLSKELAVDWLFYELSTDALLNSIYMQQKITRYVRDLNGINAYSEAEFTISKAFYESYGHDTSMNRNALHEDYISLKSGIAIELMTENLLRKNVIDSSKKAESVIDKIRNKYPTIPRLNNKIVPHNLNKIIERVSILEPRIDKRKGKIALAEIIDFQK